VQRCKEFLGKLLELYVLVASVSSTPPFPGMPVGQSGVAVRSEYVINAISAIFSEVSAVD
jgi:hypothetical protein